MYHNGEKGCSPFRFLCKYGPTDKPHEVELTVSSMKSTSCDNYEEMCAGEDEADKGVKVVIDIVRLKVGPGIEIFTLWQS